MYEVMHMWRNSFSFPRYYCRWRCWLSSTRSWSSRCVRVRSSVKWWRPDRRSATERSGQQLTRSGSRPRWLLLSLCFLFVNCPRLLPSSTRSSMSRSRPPMRRPSSGLWATFSTAWCPWMRPATSCSTAPWATSTAALSCSPSVDVSTGRLAPSTPWRSSRRWKEFTRLAAARLIITAPTAFASLPSGRMHLWGDILPEWPIHLHSSGGFPTTREIIMPTLPCRLQVMVASDVMGSWQSLKETRIPVNDPNLGRLDKSRNKFSRKMYWMNDSVKWFHWTSV